MSGAAFVAQEERVIAHLFWAVVSVVEQVTVATAGRAISGRMLALTGCSRGGLRGDARTDHP